MTRRTRLAVAAGAIAVCVAVVWAWMPGSSRYDDGDHEGVEAVYERADLADGANVARALALARSVLAGGDPDASSLEGVWGSEVVLCVYRVVHIPQCAVGRGSHLGASAMAAAVALDRRLPQGSLGRAILKLDVVVGEEPGRFDGGARPHAAGTFGIRVGEVLLLPSEVLEAGLFGRNQESEPPAWRSTRLRSLLARRGEHITDPFDFSAVHTASWVEVSPAGRLVRLYRLHAFERRDATDPEVLLEAAVMAAEHLVGTVDADGRIRYTWDTRRGRERSGYNLLRHAGTTYSLISAWERVPVSGWQHAAKAAIGYLLANSNRDERQGPFGGGEVQYVVEGSHLKLGGAGLAVVALASWQHATADTAYLEDAQAYARFLVSQQQETGEFVYFAPLEVGGEARDDTSAYYPGEAILGLTLLYELDSDPLWRDTAIRGADWLIDTRDKGKSARRLANDHWLMIALSHLYVVTEDPRYVEHSLRLAAAVNAQAARHAGHDAFHRDYLGGYYEPPRSTPAATRAEGLIAVLDTCAAAERVDCSWVQDLLTDTVSHMMQCQYTPDVVWWMPRPEQVVGGFSGGLVDPDLRNDYTQHALSALLGAERHLRAGDAPTLGPAQVDALRQPVVDLRGPTRWDGPQTLDTGDDSL